MKKLFNKRNLDTPFYLSSLLLIVVLILWFFPQTFNLTNDNYSVTQFRSDLKDLTSIFYIVITLWLVLVTRKMAEVSLNSQKAFNRPELLCELFISNDKPTVGHFTKIEKIEIRNTPDSEYNEGLEGANVFLIIKNRYGWSVRGSNELSSSEIPELINKFIDGLEKGGIKIEGLAERCVEICSVCSG